jgi:hypothetical protein
LMFGTGYRFSFQTCMFRLAAMLTQIIYGIRSPPAMGDTPKNKKIDILIALGYYDREKLGPVHGREPIDKIVSFNSY